MWKSTICEKCKRTHGLASWRKVLTQPASQKLLATQFFTPKVEAVAVPTVLSDK